MPSRPMCSCTLGCILNESCKTSALTQEIDELCDEWEPEPLYPPVSAAQAAWKEPVISSQAGTQVCWCDGRAVAGLRHDAAAGVQAGRVPAYFGKVAARCGCRHAAGRLPAYFLPLRTSPGGGS